MGVNQDLQYRRYHIVTLGCFRNEVDSDCLRSHLRRLNMHEVPDILEAEVVFINTCGFIVEAKEESIDTILEVAELIEKSGRPIHLILIGCMSQRYGDELLKELPEVSSVLGVDWQDRIDETLGSVEDGKRVSLVSEKARPGACYRSIESSSRGPLFVRVSDGCDNRCSYCALPTIRGPLVSRPIEDIVDEVGRMTEEREREVVLVAQDVASYGLDIYGKQALIDLIRKLTIIEGVRWLRLLYLQPGGIGSRLIDEIANNSKVVNYLDVPFQHASGRILKDMNRPGSREENLELIRRIRESIPYVAMRTTLMVGFPGETDDDFEELLDFTEKARFDWLGVFKYSREEKTPAWEMRPQVEPETSRNRYDRILRLQEAIAAEKASEQLGKHLEILVDGPSDVDGYPWMGRSYREAPLVDGTIYLIDGKGSSGSPLHTGSFVRGKISSMEGLDLVAEI